MKIEFGIILENGTEIARAPLSVILGGINKKTGTKFVRGINGGNREVLTLAEYDARPKAAHVFTAEEQKIRAYEASIRASHVQSGAAADIRANA